MARNLSPSVRPSVGSLFSGIGGFDLGFEWAGFEIVWQCEQNEFCRRALRKHWPNVPCYSDVRTLVADASGIRCDGHSAIRGVEGQSETERRVRELAGSSPRHARRVDVLIGGFPCQDVSSAGKRAGLAGARSGLWYEFDRCVGEFRPRVVVVENVRGLLVRGVDAVLGCLADRGYDAEWALVRARDVGAPHQRARLFIVAYASRDGGRVGPGSVPRADDQEQEPRASIRQSAAASLGDEGLADTAIGGQRMQRREDRTERSGHADERRPRCSKCGKLTEPHERTSLSFDGCYPVCYGHCSCGVANAAELQQGQGREQRAWTDAAGHRSADGISDPSGERLPRAECEDISPTWRRVEGRTTEQFRGWPAGPGEPQHDWEPSRTIPSARAQSALGLNSDGISRGLARWRRAALASTGNAVVPHVAEIVGRRVMAILDSFTVADLIQPKGMA